MFFFSLSKLELEAGMSAAAALPQSVEVEVTFDQANGAFFDAWADKVSPKLVEPKKMRVVTQLFDQVSVCENNEQRCARASLSGGGA